MRTLKVMFGLYMVASLLIFTGCFTPREPNSYNEIKIERKIKYTPADYQMNVDSLGYTIYDQKMRVIGRLKYGVNPSLDSLIDKDNQ